MYSFIYNFLISPLGLPINAVWEWAILAVIEIVAYKIAWKISPGGFFGSEIHWTVRTIAFFVIWTITYGAILAIKFVIENWLIFVCLGIILAIVMIVVDLKRLGRKNDA